MIIKKEEDIQLILEQEKELKDIGHFVRIKNLLSKEINIDGVHIINNVEKDITNRGIDLNMSTDEKLKKYLEIKDISNSHYLDIGKQLCNLQDIDINDIIKKSDIDELEIFI